MNSLVEKYGDKIGVVGVACNQFGHQANEGPDEFLNTLKYVRPGNGFEPKCDIYGKVYVNGAQSHPLFKWMRECIPIPVGEGVDTKENGIWDENALILPRGGFDDTTVTLWAPVCRSDIAWNFEKFLVGPNGQLVQRYSRYHNIDDIHKDIDALLTDTTVPVKAPAFVA